MMTALRMSVCAALGLAAACATVPPPPAADTPETTAHARLVIAGGGLRQGQGDIYRAFLGGRTRDGPVLIVPAAADRPVQSAQRTATALMRHGADREMLSVLPLAAVDDEATDENEADWAKNAEDDALAAIVETAAAIWFTGGDQTRIVALLVREDGAETPVLGAIRRAHEDGAVIGGSSAGAAMMSPVMITLGDSLSSLHPSPDAENTVTLAAGLGFFEHGLIDQHFGQRARLGRLVSALFDSEPPIDRGFGIDENTALIVDSAGGFTVAGTGYVAIVDRSDAVRSALPPSGAAKVDGLQLSLLSQGDRFDPQTLLVTPAPYKSPTIGNEFAHTPRSRAAGVTSAIETLASIVGEGLVDTKGVDTTSRVGFVEDGRGVRYVFRQTERSKGHWGRGTDDGGRYTVQSIDMSIEPVIVAISDVGP